MLTPDDILADHFGPVITLANRLRSLLCDLVPDFVERPCPGWHAIGFAHPSAGYVCGLFPQQAAVRLV